MAIKCDYPKSNPVFALQLNMPALNEGTSVLNSTNNDSIRVCALILLNYVTLCVCVYLFKCRNWKEKSMFFMKKMKMKISMKC